MRILGLDISSSTIGYGILDENGVLLDYGHIKPLKKAKADKLGKGYTYRLADTYDKICDFLKEKKPDLIVIEDYARKFPKGKSTANTIIVLATFNEAISIACYKTIGLEPLKYDVRTMRSQVGKHYDVKIPKKEDVFPFVCEKYPGLEITYTRHGNVKQEHYDEADGIFVCMAHLIMEKENE